MGYSIGWAEGVAALGFAPILLLVLSAMLLAAVSVGFVVSLGLWVYHDATERTDEPVLWTLLVLLIPTFIGLIIYLLAGRDKTKTSTGRYKKPLIIFAICLVLMVVFFVVSLVYFLFALVDSDLVTRIPGWWVPGLNWFR